MLVSTPADCLLLIRDARLPERPVGLLQAEGNSPLQVIFIVPSQVNDIYSKGEALRYKTVSTAYMVLFSFNHDCKVSES